MSKMYSLVSPVVICVVVVLCPMQRPSEMKSGSHLCQRWQSRVDATVKPPEDSRDADQKDPHNTLVAIECLLKMEGNKHPARFSGAVNDEVSQIFPQATADVAALYYISYLYYQKWEHADAIALRGANGEVNTPEVINEAYRSYRRWFEEVKTVGIVRAREMKLDPLKDTKVTWY